MWTSLILLAIIDYYMLKLISLILHAVIPLSLASAFSQYLTACIGLVESKCPEIVWRAAQWLFDGDALTQGWSYNWYLLLALVMIKTEMAIGGLRLWIMHVLFDLPAILIIIMWEKIFNSRINRLSEWLFGCSLLSALCVD